jgi:hypothetical protein
MLSVFEIRKLLQLELREGRKRGGGKLEKPEPDRGGPWKQDSRFLHVVGK